MCALPWCWSVLCTSVHPWLYMYAVTCEMLGKKSDTKYIEENPYKCAIQNTAGTVEFSFEMWPCYCENGNSTYLPAQSSHNVSLCEAVCFLSPVLKCHKFSWKTISWHWLASRLTASKDSTQKQILLYSQEQTGIMQQLLLSKFAHCTLPSQETKRKGCTRHPLL